MTARLKLLCHASTSATRTSAFPADEPIDAQGRRKLAALTHRLHDADRLLTSPALRAVQTAEALRLGAVATPALRDCDYGRWSGLSLEEAHEREPEAVAEWLRDPEAAPHGGESIAALMARVGNWLDGCKATPGVTLAVTHASVIRAAIVLALDAGPRSFWRIDIAPLSLTKLSGDRGRWTLVSTGPIKAEAE
jgi:broad specificity phosphatase PhoE